MAGGRAGMGLLEEGEEAVVLAWCVWWPSLTGCLRCDGFGERLWVAQLYVCPWMCVCVCSSPSNICDVAPAGPPPTYAG